MFVCTHQNKPAKTLDGETLGDFRGFYQMAAPTSIAVAISTTPLPPFFVGYGGYNFQLRLATLDLQSYEIK
eukprot:5028920-Prymnesium_polylepis.1